MQVLIHQHIDSNISGEITMDLEMDAGLMGVQVILCIIHQ